MSVICLSDASFMFLTVFGSFCIMIHENELVKAVSKLYLEYNEDYDNVP